MIGSQIQLARRYAQAYLNVYIDRIQREDFYAFEQLLSFFEQNKRLLFLVRIMPPEQQIHMMQKLFQQMHTEHLLDSLAGMLIRHKRIILLPVVIKQIGILYKERKKIMDAFITSSQPVSLEDLKVMQDFFARKTGYTILCTHTVDKKLIAGIRLQSATALWEYSIRKQLSALNLSLIR